MLALTGATGYLGRAVLGALRRAACPVTTLGRHQADPAVPHRELALEDPAGFRDALSGMDTLLHLAGVAHHGGDSATLERVNIRATQALADAAISAGCRRLVYVSSLNVVPAEAASADLPAARMPRPDDAYSRSKWEAEQRLEALCAGSSLELVLVRPALVYDDELVASLLQLQQFLARFPLRLPATGSRSMISRADLAELLRVLATDPAPAPGVSRVPVSEGGCYSLARIAAGLQGGQQGWLPVPAWMLALAARYRDRRSGLSAGSTWRGLAGQKWCAEQPQPDGFQPRRRFGALP